MSSGPGSGTETLKGASPAARRGQFAGFTGVEGSTYVGVALLGLPELAEALLDDGVLPGEPAALEFLQHADGGHARGRLEDLLDVLLEGIQERRAHPRRPRGRVVVLERPIDGFAMDVQALGDQPPRKLVDVEEPTDLRPDSGCIQTRASQLGVMCYLHAQVSRSVCASLRSSRGGGRLQAAEIGQFAQAAASKW